MLYQINRYICRAKPYIHRNTNRSMVHTLKSGIIITGTLVLCLAACQKKQVQQVDNESQSVVDHTIADQEYSVLAPLTLQFAINTNGTGAQGNATHNTCDTLSRLSGDTLFGSLVHLADPVYRLYVPSTTCGQTMPDGGERSGSLQVRLTNKMHLTGAQCIIKLNDYVANHVQYTCDSVVLTTLASSTSSTTFNVKLINGLCLGSGWAVKFNFNRTITCYNSGGPDGAEPYYTMDGTANGLNRNGTSFTSTINTALPLKKYRSCRFISAGQMDLTPDGFKTRTIDFGNGTCDKDATFTVNGNTIAFNLK